MTDYRSYSDDFYVNMNLNTEMELPSGRETVLHFFEQLRKRYPSMKNFYSRERGEFVLEEDKDRGSYRWTTIEPKRICSGYVNPDSVDLAVEQHAVVLESIPYTLSASPLDCESVNFMFGFDFNYRGNHNQLLAEALGVSPAFEKLIEVSSNALISNEPSIQFAIDDDCRTLCRLSFEARTIPYHVRTGEYPEEQLSVYLTMRRFGSLSADETYLSTMNTLRRHCEEIINNHVIENILVPLQQTIAIK